MTTSDDHYFETFKAAPIVEETDADYFYNFLKMTHGQTGRFTITPRNMVIAQLLPGWNSKRIQKAKKALLEGGLIRQISDSVYDQVSGYYVPALFVLEPKKERRQRRTVGLIAAKYCGNP